MKWILISLMSFILIFSLVSAETSIIPTQIMITSPNDKFLKNTESTLTFAVFNTSGNKLTSSSANCNIIISNKSDIILSDNLDYSNGLFYINLSSDIYSREGIYSYVTYCNSSNQDGFLDDKFEVSSSSLFYDSDGSKGLGVIISIIGILLILTIIMLNIAKEHIILSFFLSFVIIFSLGLLPSLFLGNFSGVTLLKVTTWTTRISIIYVFMYLVFKYIFKWKIK